MASFLEPPPARESREDTGYSFFIFARANDKLDEIRETIPYLSANARCPARMHEYSRKALGGTRTSGIIKITNWTKI